MRTPQVPKPNAQFKRNAQRLKTLLAKGTQQDGGVEARETRASLREMFAQAFDFEEDRLRTTERFYHRFSSSHLRPQEQVFDHTDFFRRNDSFVIVSQPYGFDEAELMRWSQDSGATYTVVEEWAYYYPGRASLFFVEFTPQAKRRFDACLRRPC